MPGVAPPPTQELEGKAGKIGEQSNERTSLYLTSSHLLSVFLSGHFYSRKTKQTMKSKTHREKLLLKKKCSTTSIMPEGELGLPVASGQLSSYWVPSMSLSLNPHNNSLR